MVLAGRVREITGRAIWRVVEVAVALLVVATLIFGLSHLSGDPASLFLQPGMSEQDMADIRQRLGLDQPIATQYVRYLGGLLQADAGTSFFYHQPAINVVLERLPATLQLAGASAFVALVLGLGAGLIQGGQFGPPLLREAVRWFVLMGQSIPVFLLGLLFILVFAVNLRLLPAGGSGTFAHLILPALSLGLYFAPALARLLQSSLQETLTEDFVTFARSKGMSKNRIVFRHALPSALMPVIALGAMQIGLLLNGTVVTETIFAWPGVGRLVVDAVMTKDFPVVQIGTLFGAIAFMAINLFTDAVHSVLDVRAHRQ